LPDTFLESRLVRVKLRESFLIELVSRSLLQNL
jgi:hypothetical protein